MKKEDLRLVEFVLKTNTLKDFKIIPKHADNSIGSFHLWRVERKAYANEFFVGLIEDFETGELYQVRSSKIRFLTQLESDEFFKSKNINPQFLRINTNDDGMVW